MSARLWRIVFLGALATTGAAGASLRFGPPARVCWADRGAELLSRGHPGQAVVALEHISAGARNPATRYQLGTALLGAGRAEDATATLSSAAVSSDPDIRLRSLHNLALAHLALAREKAPGATTPHVIASMEAGRAAIRLDPEDVGARRNLALAMRLLARNARRSSAGDAGAVRLPRPGGASPAHSGNMEGGAAAGVAPDPGPMDPDEARRVLDAVESGAAASLQVLLARMTKETAGARRRRTEEGPPW